MKYYVGLLKDVKRETFRYVSDPTMLSHGNLYLAVIGPFRTRRGAEFMARCGGGNPHCQTVADAERISRYEVGQRGMQ